MDEENPLTWEAEPSENFLDDHFLFRGIPRVLWKNWPDINKIQPNFFMVRNAINGLSMDWSKYAIPEFTLKHLPKPTLTENGIIEINIGKLKICINENSFNITIIHDPIREPTETEPINHAHTLIMGINNENKTKVRRKVSKIAKWAPNMTPNIEQK